MISVMSFSEAQEFLKTHLAFFNFDEYTGGEHNFVIRPRNHQRFLDVGPTPEYLNRELLLSEWLTNVLFQDKDGVWVRPAEGRWVYGTSVNHEKVHEDTLLRRWLASYGMGNRFLGMINLRDELVCNSMIVCGLRGQTRLELLVPSMSLIAIPCDHGDIHLFGGMKFDPGVLQSIGTGLEVIHGASCG